MLPSVTRELAPLRNASGDAHATQLRPRRPARYLLDVFPRQVPEKKRRQRPAAATSRHRDGKGAQMARGEEDKVEKKEDKEEEADDQADKH